MNIIATAKAGGVALEAFRAKGWTDDALVQHGYAERVVVKTVAPTPAPVLKPEPLMAISGHGESKRRAEELGPAVPNAFGVTDLSEVTAAFREFAGPMRARYPHGWSYEQQILFTAELLWERRK